MRLFELPPQFNAVLTVIKVFASCLLRSCLDAVPWQDCRSFPFWLFVSAPWWLLLQVWCALLEDALALALVGELSNPFVGRAWAAPPACMDCVRAAPRANPIGVLDRATWAFQVEGVRRQVQG